MAKRMPRSGEGFPYLSVVAVLIVVLLVSGGAAAEAYASRPSTRTVALAGPTTSKGPLARRRDQAATRRYLDAEDAYERAWLASAPSIAANVGTLESQLDGECHDVAAGALEAEGENGLLGGNPDLPPRAWGEANRRAKEMSELQGEASEAVLDAVATPSRNAELSYAHTLMTLRWSNPAITRVEHGLAKEIEWDLRQPALGVCSDLRGWVASGYTRLTLPTKRFVEEAMATSLAYWNALKAEHAASATDFINEGPERKLLSEINHIQSRRRHLQRAAEARILSQLGLIEAQDAQRLEEREGPPKGAVVIEKGRTVAGGRFTISVLPKRLVEEDAARCAFGIRVEESLLGTHSRQRGDSRICMNRADPGKPTVECSNGVVTIEAQFPGEVRKVRLGLSNGRSVVSPTAQVPSHLGGPAAFYYQTLRGPSPYPVWAAELGQGGRILRTVRLPQRAHCVWQPSQPTSPKVTTRTIAAVKVSDGLSFSIVGETDPRSHRLSISLDIEVLGFGSFEFPTSPGFEARSESLSVPENVKHAQLFVSNTHSGCQPHQYAIAYGVLQAKQDHVLGRVASGLVPLREVQLPRSLDLGGALVYGTLPETPTELMVRNPAGKTLTVVNLAHRAAMAREVCEGEAEPAG